MARPRRLALGLHNMGSRDHLRQPPARIRPVRVLGAEATRRDEQFAPSRYLVPGDLLQSLISLRMQSEPEQVDAKLDRRCDLVDVLSPRASRRQEALAQRLLGDDHLFRLHGANRRNVREAAR